SYEVAQEQLPTQGTRKLTGHQAKIRKHNFKRSIRDLDHDYPDYQHELGYLASNTLVVRHHKTINIQMVTQITKSINAINPNRRQADNDETSLNKWFGTLPRHIFKSIIFDNGKEFSNWKNISNKQNIDIYFADPGTQSQRGLNEHSNGLLRKNGLPKVMD